MEREIPPPKKQRISFKQTLWRKTNVKIPDQLKPRLSMIEANAFASIFSN